MPRPKLKMPLRGLFVGLKITFGIMIDTMFPKRGIKTLLPAPTLGAVTVQYPHESEAPADRARVECVRRGRVVFRDQSAGGPRRRGG